MKLEAVWFKNGKEIYRVCPVMNIVCDDDMNSIASIEVESGYQWYSSVDIGEEADDFVIRINKD